MWSRVAGASADGARCAQQPPAEFCALAHVKATDNEATASSAIVIQSRFIPGLASV